MADRIKLALFGLHRGGSADPDTLIRRARLAEEAGFESLWIGDHIALPAGDKAFAAYPPEQPRLECIVALSYMAALTSRVRLGVGVIVLPQRQPVLLAKQLSTIDVLSKGRLIVGIGVGYMEPELRAMGTSLAERAARTDEYLEAMRALWREEVPAPSFAGRFVSFSDVVERPRPVQQPHLPIVVGGHTEPAFRRTVKVGNGWHGFNMDLEETASALDGLRAAASRYGRPAELGELEITITPKESVDVDLARRYADLGVHRLAIQQRDMNGPEMDDLIAMVGDRLVGKV
jgi:probable F420-dependent oxidoreductase